MLLAVLASIALFVMDSHLEYFKPVRAALSTAVYPVQVVASVPSGVVDWANNFFQSRQQLRRDMASMEVQVLTQSVRLQKMQSLESENMRLRELLGSSFRLQERVQVAELVSVEMDPFYQHVLIDKGEQFGVYEGQPVLDSRGVMGQVAAVSQFSSRVVLLTDPSHSIPVQVVRNGLRAVATGRGLAEPLSLEFLPHNIDVRVGDSVVTSGLGGRFPAGYPVGRIVEVNFPQGKAFAEISVHPAAQLSTSREVMLVLPGEKIDFGAPFVPQTLELDTEPSSTDPQPDTRERTTPEIEAVGTP